MYDKKHQLIYPTYRADIDGLRAIAILLVIGYHAFPDWIFGGFIGVDVFFVISGFLISNIIYQSLEKNQFSYAEFYSRRIKRIFPALTIVLTVSFAFGWYVLLPNEFRQLEKSVAASAGFVSNFSLWNEAGYFDNSADTKPLQHLWSLAVEEQFYIIWPLLLGLLWRKKFGFLTATLLIGATSFLINVVVVHSDTVAAFYSPLSRFWELMFGAALAYLTIHRPQYLNRQSDIQSIAGLILISAASILIGKDRMFPGWWALLPTLGTFLLISAGPSAWLNRKLLARRELVGVGLISYPLYLWHWPLLVFLKLSVERNLVVFDKLVIISIAFLLSYLTYIFLEIPVRKGFLRKPVVMLSMSLACILIVSSAFYYSGVTPRNKSDAISRYLLAAYDWEYPDGIEHRIFAGHLRRAYSYNGNLPTRTLFVGDSNMEQYYPRVKQLIIENPNEYNSAVFVGNQRQRCNPIVDIFLTEDNQCNSVMHDITDLANDKNTQAVVLAYAGASYDLLTRGTIGQSKVSQFISSLRKNGKRVYVILNIPDGEELDPTNMFTGSRLTKLGVKNVKDIRFDYQNFLHRYGVIRNKMRRAAVEGGAIIVDPLETLCLGEICPVFDRNENPLYKDSKHMTASYARRSASYIDQALKHSH